MVVFSRGLVPPGEREVGRHNLPFPLLAATRYSKTPVNPKLTEYLALIKDTALLRYSCLIIGVLATLLFLSLLVTCRITGLPFAEGNEQIEGVLGAESWRSTPQGLGLQLDGMGQVVGDKNKRRVLLGHQPGK